MNSKIDQLDYEKDFYPAVMDALFRCNSWIAIVMITDLLARKYRFNVPGTKANLNWTRRIQRSIAKLRSSRKEQKRMRLIHESAGENTTGVISTLGSAWRLAAHISAPSPKCFQTQVIVLAVFREKVRDGEGATASTRAACAPQRLYALFSIGAPTLLPHSVHEPS